MQGSQVSPPQSLWVLVSCTSQKGGPRSHAHRMPRLFWCQAQQGSFFPEQGGRDGLRDVQQEEGRFRARTESPGYFHRSFTGIAYVSWISGLCTLVIACGGWKDIWPGRIIYWKWTRARSARIKNPFAIGKLFIKAKLTSCFWTARQVVNLRV